jgi:rod shape-determining protein MreC
MDFFNSLLTLARDTSRFGRADAGDQGRPMLSFLKRHQVIFVSVLLSIVSLHLALTDRREVARGYIVKEIVSFAVHPLQRAAMASWGAASGIWSDYIALIGVKADNAALREALVVAEAENNRLREELSLAGRLKDILAYRDAAPFDSMASVIVGLNFDGWTRTAVIDKGADDGVRKDSAALSPSGVVGRVIEVNGRTSRVLLTTDMRSNIDVIVERTRVKGVAEGTGSDGLTLKYVRQVDDVQVGDAIITSGLSGIFPKGLPVGEVSKIEKGRDNFFKHIEVRPEVDFARIEEVLVVTDAAPGAKPGTAR